MHIVYFLSGDVIIFWILALALV